MQRVGWSGVATATRLQAARERRRWFHIATRSASTETPTDIGARPTESASSARSTDRSARSAGGEARGTVARPEARLAKAASGPRPAGTGAPGRATKSTPPARSAGDLGARRRAGRLYEGDSVPAHRSPRPEEYSSPVALVSRSCAADAVSTKNEGTLESTYGTTVKYTVQSITWYNWHSSAKNSPIPCIRADFGPAVLGRISYTALQQFAVREKAALTKSSCGIEQGPHARARLSPREPK